MSPVTKIIREVKYKLQTIKVPTPVVPEITIYIDGKTILNLVRDNKLSTNSELILRTDGSQAGPDAPSKVVKAAAVVSQTTNDSNDVKSIQDAAGSSTVKSIQDVLDSGKSTATSANIADSKSVTDEDNAKGMDTENPGARLRYDLGCRYLAASRFDVAEKEFRLAFKMDQTFIAPLLMLQELAEITGREIEIPTAEPEDSSPQENTAKTTSDSTSKNTSEGSSEVTTKVKTEQQPDVNIHTSVTNVKNNDARNTKNRSETNDSILFTGLIIAVILVVIKLVFIDDVKN